MKEWFTGDICFEDFGDQLGIDGVIYGDGKRQIILLTPEGNDVDKAIRPSRDEWEKILKNADLGTHAVTDPNNKLVIKAIYHKSKRQIEQTIVWEVYRRDNFTCVYCGRNDVPLTVDHYVPQALGGLTTVDNLRTACRKCNKRKGDMPPQDWENVK